MVTEMSIFVESKGNYGMHFYHQELVSQKGGVVKILHLGSNGPEPTAFGPLLSALTSTCQTNPTNVLQNMLDMHKLDCPL